MWANETTSYVIYSHLISLRLVGRIAPRMKVYAPTHTISVRWV